MAYTGGIYRLQRFFLFTVIFRVGKINEVEPLLKGIKVLAIAAYIFGPGSAAILSDFGADVIKVEAPGRGDPLRYAHKAPPFMPLEFGYIWQQDNRNKRSIGLDMKSAEGREILLMLVRQTNIVVLR